MLAEKILAIVIAIGRANDGVHMEAFGFLVGKENAAVMVKFYQRNRTMNAAIKRIHVIGLTNPREMGSVQIALDLVHACFGWSARHVANELLAQGQQCLALFPVEVGAADAFERHDPIILKRPTNLAAIIGVKAPLGLISRQHRII